MTDENISVNININDIKCPISQQIFCDPVIAEDGIIYERSCISQWLNDSVTSPITRQEISNSLIPVLFVKTLVNNYLNANPDKKCIQFKPCLDYFLNKKKVHTLINIKNFEQLLNYGNFKLRYMYRNDTLEKLFAGCQNINVLKHVIDNIVDIDAEDEYGWRLIHFVCRYSLPEIIKYLVVSHKIDIEEENNYGWRPIHFICRYSTPDMIKYFIELGVDLECEDNEKMKPIHYICQFSTPEMIMYIIDKNVNLENEDEDGWQPIHYICKFSTIEVLKYILEKRVPLHELTKAKQYPLSILCQHQTREVITYALENEFMTEQMEKNKIVKYLVVNNKLSKDQKISLLQKIL